MAVKLPKKHTVRPRKPGRETPGPRTADELLVFVENIKRQWMATIDAMVDPLMIVNADYTIVKANKAMASMSNRTIREIVGSKCHEVFANSKKPCSGCKMKNAAKTFQNETFNLEQVRGDRYYEVASQPIVNPDGGFEGVVQVYRDRTEAKLLQDQLMQNEKLASIGLLAGGIAHEINNPLGGILIFSQMLLRELPKTSSHYEDVVEIEAATQRCKAIVESLLDFARQRPPQKTSDSHAEIDIIEAAKTALRFAKVGMKTPNQIEIVEEWNATETVLEADRNRIIQLFLNLIQNAAQAMPDGGSLTLRSGNVGKGDHRELWVEVEDSGVGIPQTHLKKIFDPFFTTKDPGEGTGLGLAICYGIVQDMGGKLTVDSRINVGTRFRIALPIQKAKKRTTQNAS